MQLRVKGYVVITLHTESSPLTQYSRGESPYSNTREYFPEILPQRGKTGLGKKYTSVSQ